MGEANDNPRPNYRRLPHRASKLPFPEKRDIAAWEIDSSLDPESKEGRQIVGFG